MRFDNITKDVMAQMIEDMGVRVPSANTRSRVPLVGQFNRVLNMRREKVMFLNTAREKKRGPYVPFKGTQSEAVWNLWNPRENPAVLYNRFIDRAVRELGMTREKVRYVIHGWENGLRVYTVTPLMDLGVNVDPFNE